MNVVNLYVDEGQEWHLTKKKIQKLYLSPDFLPRWQEDPKTVESTETFCTADRKYLNLCLQKKMASFKNVNLGFNNNAAILKEN